MPNYLIIGGTDRQYIDTVAGEFVDAVRHALSIEGAQLKSGDTGNVWTREQLRLVVGNAPAAPVAMAKKRGRG